MSLAFPFPDLSNERVGPYYEAASRGELQIPRCTGCGRFNWYPPTQCIYCGGSELPWTAVSGEGRLFSWAVVGRAFARQFADQVPYVAALVTIVEDPVVRLVSNVVDCDAEALQIGMPLRVVFRELSFAGVDGSLPAPFFVPV